MPQTLRSLQSSIQYNRISMSEFKKSTILLEKLSLELEELHEAFGNLPPLPPPSEILSVTTSPKSTDFESIRTQAEELLGSKIERYRVRRPFFSNSVEAFAPSLELLLRVTQHLPTTQHLHPHLTLPSHTHTATPHGERPGHGQRQVRRQDEEERDGVHSFL